MKKNQCINCGQMLKKAPADSDYTWIGKTDLKETCYSGAVQMPNGEFISEQDHWTDSDLN